MQKLRDRPEDIKRQSEIRARALRSLQVSGLDVLLLRGSLSFLMRRVSQLQDALPDGYGMLMTKKEFDMYSTYGLMERLNDARPSRKEGVARGAIRFYETFLGQHDIPLPKNDYPFIH